MDGLLVVNEIISWAKKKKKKYYCLNLISTKLLLYKLKLFGGCHEANRGWNHMEKLGLGYSFILKGTDYGQWIPYQIIHYTKRGDTWRCTLPISLHHYSRGS